MLSLSAMEPSKNIEQCGSKPSNISVKQDRDCGHFDVFANLIIWTAKEAGADCWAEIITSDIFSSSNDLLEVNFGWDPGFKVGAGYKGGKSRWDTQTCYTWFHTKGSDDISGAPGTIHSTFLGNFYVDNIFGLGLSGPPYQKASIDWTIQFNIFDWELGYDFSVSNALSFRPFLGIKGGWINQSIDSKWVNPDLSNPDFFGAQPFNIGIESLKNNYWGIGPGAGVNTRWDLFRGESLFYLFGDFAGAMMWGHWSFNDVYQNDINQQVTVDLQDINGGSSMFRTFMGFGWDTYWRQNRYRFSTKLGYEMQFWLDQLQFYSFTGGRLTNNLSLQGGTFEFCFDF